MAVRSAKSTSPATTVAQVATPRAERTLTNWLVQVVPVYSAKIPPAPVRVRAEVKLSTSNSPEIERLVVVAFVVVAFVAKVVEAIKPRGEPFNQSPVEVALTICEPKP